MPPKHILPTLGLVVNGAFLVLAAGLILPSTREPKYRLRPLRLTGSILLTAALAIHGYRRRSLAFSGMLTASIIGCITFLTNITVFVSLIICFFATSRATRFRDNVKSRFEADFKEGGQRNWVQIVCNLGVPHLAILLQLIGSGVSADGEIDFTRNYWNSWLTVSALGAVSCALGDTLSSELGPVLAEDTDPLLITTFRPVPKGTNGGVTIAGLFASVLGGLLIGAGAWITQAFSSSPPSTHWHSPQWPILFFCLYAGLLGSLVDSLLGATFQYTGYDHFRKRITQDPPTAENPGTFVEHISGRPVLDNHSVNLLSIALMALATPLLASHFWPDGVPY